MKDKKLTVQEETRFILWNHVMTSEVKLGRTVFNVTSRMGSEANSFKDVIRRIAERQISRINKNAG